MTCARPFKNISLLKKIKMASKFKMAVYNTLLIITFVISNRFSFFFMDVEGKSCPFKTVTVVMSKKQNGGFKIRVKVNNLEIFRPKN